MLIIYFAIFMNKINQVHFYFFKIVNHTCVLNHLLADDIRIQSL